jgi:hypothetical protein
VAGFAGCAGTVNLQINDNQPIIHFYPNPNNGIFWFNLNDVDDFEVVVYNSSGQKITVPVYSRQLDLRRQKGGIYFIEIITKQETYRGRIVKRD